MIRLIQFIKVFRRVPTDLGRYLHSILVALASFRL